MALLRRTRQRSDWLGDMDKIRVMYRNPNALKGKGWKKIHGLTWGNLGKGEEESPFSRLDILCRGDFKRTSFRRLEVY